MNCHCKVDQRRLTPGVFNLKQFLNGSETMVWELDNCVINQGTCDLKNYDAFLTLCVGGEIDEILLTKRQSGDKLQLIWDVGVYATALTGYVKYQICFRSAAFDTLGVIADDPEVNGVYTLTDHNATGNARIYKKAENGYTIKWDTANGRWALYKADGATVVDYQTTPNTEPHCGLWANIGVGNNEAAAWISDEAIMYISESIAADQTITGGFPTILRQLWKKIAKAGVTSVNGKVGIVELAPDDIGAAAKQHKHQIADTDGLQAALNNKANAGHTHTIANVSGLQSALDGKFSIAGGAITGREIKRSAADSYIHILGGNGTYNTDGQLVLYGSDYSGNTGGFELRAADGNTYISLAGRKDGWLTWQGKNLVRSIDGVNADSAGNVAIGALKTTGGTMTGTIKVPEQAMRATTDSGVIRIYGGTGADSAGIFLFGKGRNDVYAGQVYLSAQKGTDVKYLILSPDGNATWNGKHLVRSVDGVNAGADGNVALSAIKTSGGTLTGSITFSAGDILNADTKRSFAVYGGTSYTTGPSLIFYGKDYPTSGYKGVIVLSAHDGSRYVTLACRPDGTMTWNSKDITLGYPNYSAGVAVGTVSTYTATADGWVQVTKQQEATYITVKVNGAIVVNGGGSSHDRTSGIFPVKKGDVVTIFKSDLNQTSLTAVTATVTFYPNR